MRTTKRRVAAVFAVMFAVLLVVAGAALLVLSSTGVLATSGKAWTTQLRYAGREIRVNIPGLVRLATAPAMSFLLDGRALTTAAGVLRLARDDRGLRLSCAPCTLTHPDLAARPVTLQSLQLTIARDGDAIDGMLALDSIQVTFAGLLASDRIDLRWELPTTEASAAIRVFASAIPETQYARIEGTLRAQGTISLPAGKSSIVFGVSTLEVGGLGTERLQYGWFRYACAQAAGPARLVITGDGEKSWLAADAMGPYLPAAVLAAEDQRFREHAGYDETELADLLAGLDAGRPPRGASTITQQLARTLYTGHERTAVRKLRELLYAIEMERTLGKDRILELYLNTVDWGPGLCGAKAAARTYFNRTPARLTPPQAAWMAGILRNPHLAYSAQFAASAPDIERTQWVMAQMRDWPKRERQRWATQSIAFELPPAQPAAPRHPGPSTRTAASLRGRAQLVDLEAQSVSR
jgi:hypothetical protein